MINIGFMSLDILILVILFLLLFFYSYRKGKRMLTSLIFSVYPSLLIFKNFPYISFDPGMPEAIAFVLIYIVAFIVIYKNVDNRKVYSLFRKLTDYGLLSIAYLAMIISISTHSVLSLQKLYTFSGIFPNLVNKIDYGLLLVLPLILILLTSNQDKY